MEWTNSFYPTLSSALLTTLSPVPFTTEEITGSTNEAAKGGNKAPKNQPSGCFISCFTVLVTPSVNTSKSTNDFIIFIISFKFVSTYFSVKLIYYI